MSETVTIYGLFDPWTFDVRYIGLTRDMRPRMLRHIDESRKRSNHRQKWIASCISRGRAPVMAIIVLCNEKSASFWEKTWIAGLRDSGADLVNGTDGGEIKFRHSAETIEKIRAKNREHRRLHPLVFSEETRRKLSNSHKQRYLEGRSNIPQLAAARIGKLKSRESVEKAAAKLRGKKLNLTDEQRKKISDTVKRQWENPEYRKLMHESGVRHTSKPEVMAYLGKRPRNKESS